MSQTRKLLYIVMVGLALALFSLIMIRPPRTVGQQTFPQPNRRPACTCFCGDGTFKSFQLFSAADAKAGKCFGGPLPADACGRSVGEMPADQRRMICDGLKTGRSSSCPAVKAMCNESGSGNPPRPDCQKPAPWFDPSATGCADVQAPVVAITNRAVTISVCGFPVYRGSPEPPISDLALTAYKDILTAHAQSTMGSKICCDKFRESARTGSPCSPGTDIDCDGVPNSRDTYKDGNVVYPDINLFTRATNANIDRFPPGLDPDDPDFLPNSTARESKDVGDCPCKWELAAGKLACSPDGRQDHVYTATWKCPANGKEVFTTKRAAATSPCQQYRQTGMFGHFDATRLLEFLPAALRPTSCG